MAKQHRVYKKWTPEEIEMIKQGIIPENHNNHGACILKARSLGFKFKKAKRILPKNWSQADVDLLKAGIVPKGKTFKACMSVAESMNLDFKVLFNQTPWSKSELKSLKAGQIPQYRDYSTACKLASSLGINTATLKEAKSNPDTIATGKQLYMEYSSTDATVATLAAKYKTSRQNIHRMINSFKIAFFNDQVKKGLKIE